MEMRISMPMVELIQTNGIHLFKLMMIVMEMDYSIVKNAFKEPPLDPRHRHLPISREPKNPLSAVTRRPILPEDAEVKDNPRARSAKLRIAQRRPERSSE